MTEHQTAMHNINVAQEVALKQMTSRFDIVRLVMRWGLAWALAAAGFVGRGSYLSVTHAGHSRLVGGLAAAVTSSGILALCFYFGLALRRLTAGSEALERQAIVRRYVEIRDRENVRLLAELEAKAKAEDESEAEAKISTNLREALEKLRKDLDQ